MQAAGDLVGVLVELAAGVQFGEGDFGGRALGQFVLVVHLDPGRDAAAVIDDAIELSGWMVTMMSSQWPARASSMELSTTSKTRW